MHFPHVLALLAWFVGWILLFRVPRLPRGEPVDEDGDGDGTGAGVPVTIVIPARNEESSLPHLLADLAVARPPGARVIVVDDHSTDRTAEIATAHDFVEVLPAPDLEPGWTGKAWACHAGAEGAQRGSLVFLDADVRFHGDALTRAVQSQAETGGLLSIWPRHIVLKSYEHLSALFNTISFMAAGAGSLIPARRPRAAFGPVLVTSTDEYQGVGGHEAVRDDVIDDFALARVFGEADLPVRVYGGGKDVSFRMYPDGLGSLIEGWTKNFARGAVTASPLRVVGIIFWLTCAVGTLTWATGVPAPISNALYGLFAFQMLVFFKQVGTFGLLDALLYPLHAVFFILVFLRSLFMTFLRRRVSWRGRDVELGDTHKESK